ncbi:MAG: hypothetical protein AAGC46_14875 [Solirubrobacteraceae bacterium]|nr:hypothetical protein [Patulibacter sp.]
MTDAGEPFFAPLAEAPDDPPGRRYVAPPWMRIPTEFVPTLLPLVRLVGITDDGLAVVLSEVEVYPTGLRFTLRVVPRPGDDIAAAAVTGPDFYAETAGYGAPRLARRLRVGACWDDGRTATNLFLHGPEFDDEAPATVLRVDGGSGGGGFVEANFWLWPLPAAGDLTLVVAWHHRGLEEQGIVLNGDELRAAAHQSTVAEIWPGARHAAPTLPSELF